MANIEDARRAVDEAIDALTLEMWRGQSPDRMERVTGPECTIVIELERIDGALGPRGKSMFGAMAEDVRRCVIALYEAKVALK